MTSANVTLKQKAGRQRAKSFKLPYTDETGKAWKNFQSFARSHQPREVTQRAARAGFQAACAKAGKDNLHEKLRAYRNTHPSALEEELDVALQAHHLQSESNIYLFREHGSYLSIDRFLRSLNVAIEVNGNQHDPRYFPVQAAYDARKRALCAQHHIRLLELSQADRKRFPELLAAFLGLPMREA